MDCPFCHGKFEQRKVSYIYRDIYFGDFDAEVCTKCGKTFFSEEAAMAIEKIAKDKGLWGTRK